MHLEILTFFIHESSRTDLGNSLEIRRSRFSDHHRFVRKKIFSKLEFVELHSKRVGDRANRDESADSVGSAIVGVPITMGEVMQP